MSAAFLFPSLKNTAADRTRAWPGVGPHLSLSLCLCLCLRVDRSVTSAAASVPLSPRLCDLSLLRALHLTDGAVSGAVPPCLFALPELQTLVRDALLSVGVFWSFPRGTTLSPPLSARFLHRTWPGMRWAASCRRRRQAAL